MSQYAANPPPAGDLEAIRVYVGDELRRVQAQLAAWQALHYTTNAEPLPRPQEGDSAFFLADVVSEFSGLHVYDGGEWVPASPARDIVSLYQTTGAAVQAIPDTGAWVPVTTINSTAVQIGTATGNPAQALVNIGRTRPYLFGASLNTVSDRPTAAIEMGVSVNGNPPSPAGTMRLQAKQAGDYMIGRASLPISLADGATVQLQVRSADGQAHNMTTYNASLYVAGL